MVSIYKIHQLILKLIPVLSGKWSNICFFNKIFLLMIFTIFTIHYNTLTCLLAFQRCASYKLVDVNYLCYNKKNLLKSIVVTPTF